METATVRTHVGAKPAFAFVMCEGLGSRSNPDAEPGCNKVAQKSDGTMPVGEPTLRHENAPAPPFGDARGLYL